MKRLIPLVAVALVATFVMSAPVAAATRDTGSVKRAISGTIDGVAFSGDLKITKFVVHNKTLLAVGKIVNTGTAIDGQRVRMPVSNIESSGATPAAAAVTVTCGILDLTLGPLDLDLLGLVVHLDTVHLTIDAQQAPGNLLGNLLCAVAGLLDGSGGGLSGVLNQIAGLLNQILAIIG